MRRAAVLLLLVPVVAGCSSSGPKGVTILPARTFRLGGFQPNGVIRPGRATTLAFTIEQPSGSPLTAYRSGAGPHTGVHLIIVRDDLSLIIHRHPRVQAGGRFQQRIVFPAPGRYRVIVDAYPLHGVLPNFQLFKDIQVAGREVRKPLGTYRSNLVVDGFRFVAPAHPQIHARQAAFLTVRVTGAGGRPTRFVPWYGALAHAIFFHVGTLDYFHTHVCAPKVGGCTTFVGAARITGRRAAPGKLTIGVLVPTSGTWKLFLQARPEGQLVTVPYVLRVS